MAGPGVELLVAARADGVVPAWWSGSAGSGPRPLDDVAVVPLPASAARVEAALRSLRGGAAAHRRARAPGASTSAAVAELAARVGELLLEHGLSLLELNPVVATPDGAVALDAVDRGPR